MGTRIPHDGYGGVTVSRVGYTPSLYACVRHLVARTLPLKEWSCRFDSGRRYYARLGSGAAADHRPVFAWLTEEGFEFRNLGRIYSRGSSEREIMLYPDAHQHLLPVNVNHNRGGNRPRILVVHIMEGWLVPTDEMFHNPSRQASAHFGVGTDGRMFQWVDTGDQAWHAYDANTYSIGVEHAGMAADGLTDEQIQATGKLYAWAHRKYPALNLWINKRITGSGIAYHRKYDSWNLNHHTCPGDKAIKQIPAILEVAKAHS